jgi:hypothetical protein
MKLDYCKNLESLKEEESKTCNGGNMITTTIKKIVPTIIFPIPTPDSDNRL